MTTDFILHIPHDSIEIPDEYRVDFCITDDELNREIIAMTDMHTADLYDAPNTTKVIFPVSRLLVDAERFPDDVDEPMAARGMGMLYTVGSKLQSLRDKPDNNKREELKSRYYDVHHEELTSIVDESLTNNRKAMIIDCHSFPSRPLPYEMIDNTELRAEICIGTDLFHTPDSVKNELKNYFISKGYSVSIDDPFAGALTPLKHYGQTKDVMAVMYEVRRDLYMDEVTGEKNNKFDVIKTDILESIQLLNKLFNC
jgi:N-formylglutamate deformylase